MSTAQLHVIPEVDYSDPSVTTSEKIGSMSDYWRWLLANNDSGKFLSEEDYAFYADPNNYEPETIDEYIARKEAADPYSHLPCV